MGETWRRIPLHPGYEASSEGRVRSVHRTLTDGREAGGVVLTPTPDKDGYLRVKLGRKTVGVHVLVCLAFHGPPEVRHLGDGVTDNRPDRICWGSRRDNERDKKRKKREEERKNGTRDASVPHWDIRDR